MRKRSVLIGVLILMGGALAISLRSAAATAPASGDKPCQIAPAAATTFVLAVAAAQPSTEYHGNTDSKIFHGPSCRYYNCGHCTKVFSTRQAAIDAGYRPCKVCNP